MSFLKGTSTTRLLAWVGRRMRRLPAAALFRGAVWGLPIAGLELLGRRSPTDFVDAAGALGLLLLGLAMWIRFEGGLRRWLGRGLGAGLRRRLARVRPRIGLDFRRKPPLPRRLPSAVLWIFGGVLCVALAVWLTRGVFPTAARGWLQSVSGFLMLAMFTGLWGVLAAGALLGYLYPLFSLDLELSSSPDRAEARARLRTLGAPLWFLFLTACATWLPLTVALGATAGAATVLALAVSIPCGHPLRFAWRSAGSTETPSSFSWSACLAGGAVAFAAVTITFMLLGAGERLAGEGGSETRLTAFLATCFAWGVAGGTVYGLGEAAYEVLQCRLRDPARPAPVTVHLSRSAGSDRRSIVRALERAGFRIARNRRPLPMDVCLNVVPERTEELRFMTGWPRVVVAEDSIDPELHRTLRRRAEILRRREVCRGLQLLFKRAAARGFREGQGFWVAPHLWFITHLSRDGEDDELWRIGPGYRQALTREARHHLHTVLETLEIDLIFVEDGVGYRRFKRVLAMLFEYFDIFGTRRLEDERHFAGLPGVRVLLHDFQLEQPLRTSRYPEPDYDGVGRARILHVFRDRGGETEDELVPFDWDTLPSPGLPTLVPV
jgi:hypothetical protein